VLWVDAAALAKAAEAVLVATTWVTDSQGKAVQIKADPAMIYKQVLAIIATSCDRPTAVMPMPVIGGLKGDR
jgi:hypothetical protein